MSPSANRILFVHPEDAPPAKGDYDLIVDLGHAPASTYSDWSRESGCSVTSISNFRDPMNDLRSLRELMQFGTGHVLDETGLDWWDLISLRFYEQMLEVFALRRLLTAYGPACEIFITRSGFRQRAVQAISEREVKIRESPNALRTQATRKLARLWRLRPRQVFEILGDKYDGDYRLRRHFARRTRPSSDPVVLLPTAYGNASRTALAYAGALPDQKFLLVATRPGGWVEKPPSNVNCVPLAAFAPGKCNSRDLQHLLSSWQSLLSAFAEHRELSVLVRAGCFDSVAAILKEGLCIRDAWEEVFASNLISAVLCADEMNWNTRIPLLLARARGLPAIACHHGALDFRYAFRETSADRLLVKGRMEWDYLTSRGLPEHHIEIGAPPLPTKTNSGHQLRKDAIVFFSEPYEVFGGRALGFYREILPSLADLALQHGKELILKLHPYESRRERRRMAEAVLSLSQRDVLQVVDGPLQQDLLNRAWFGVTINSTTAVDCAVSDVPVFLCRWLDTTYSGYSDHFIKFGAARKLSCIDEILDIPRTLTSFNPPRLTDLSNLVGPARLRELLSGTRSLAVEAENAERVGA